MPFDWSSFLTLAQELAQREDESALRSAIIEPITPLMVSVANN